MANWVANYLERNPDKVEKISSRNRSSITLEIGKGEYQTECLGGPIHYFDREWKPIDTKLVAIGSEYGAPGLKTRIGIDGSVRIIDKKNAFIHSQMTMRIGVLNLKNKKFLITHILPSGHVDNDSIIREARDILHRLILTEKGLREELTITKSYGDFSDFFCLETIFGTKQLWPDGWINKQFVKGQHIFPHPCGIDAKDKIVPMHRYAKYIGGIQYLYIGVFTYDLEKYSFPIIFDPDYLCHTGDGFVVGGGYNYSLARTTAVDHEIYLEYEKLYVGQMGDFEEGYTYQVKRSYLKFDTSGIPDDAFIRKVNVKLYLISDYSIAHDFDVNIIKQDWSEYDPISIDTRQGAFVDCLSSPEDDNIWRNTSGISSNTQYASGNLSTSWVNKAGYTWYSLASNRDYDGSGIPPGYAENEWIRLGHCDSPIEITRPVLTVLHSTIVPLPAYRSDL